MEGQDSVRQLHLGAGSERDLPQRIRWARCIVPLQRKADGGNNYRSLNDWKLLIGVDGEFELFAQFTRLKMFQTGNSGMPVWGRTKSSLCNAPELSHLILPPSSRHFAQPLLRNAGRPAHEYIQ
jgi:hypothetical protein